MFKQLRDYPMIIPAKMYCIRLSIIGDVIDVNYELVYEEVIKIPILKDESNEVAVLKATYIFDLTTIDFYTYGQPVYIT